MREQFGEATVLLIWCLGEQKVQVAPEECAEGAGTRAGEEAGLEACFSTIPGLARAAKAHPLRIALAYF